MRVFNINKAVGLASSGVEYAQKYRRELLAGIEAVEDLYVFTDYLHTNVSIFTDLLGFDRAQVRWIYDVVSGRETRGCTLTLDQALGMIAQPYEEPQPQPGYLDVPLTGSRVRYRLWTTADGHVDRIETQVDGQYIRVEHYDETLNNVEHFHEGRIVRRVFHAPDGAVTAVQHYRDREITRTVITPASPLYDAPTRRGRPSAYTGDVVLEGRTAFFRHVFERLIDRPDDVVIVDRALDVIDGIYPVIGERRLYSVVHAEHFDLRQIDDGVLLWNNHYEHVFTRPDLVDGLIVSTHRQQQVLEGQLPSEGPEVVRIPVGVAEPLPPSSEGSSYDRFALVTASRLADEKHIDLLIRAVATARSSLPEIRLDVYGEGNRAPLLAAIEETGTQDCVRLMGHHELRGVLGTYALYVSASTSEGFGLSLLEALAEGLPIVGFDVDYGNREMIEQDVNGRLVPRMRTDTEAMAQDLTRAIVEVLTGDLDAMRRASLRKAEAYTHASVRRLWERLLLAETPREARC